MKRAKPKDIAWLTGSDDPEEQCRILRRELGLTPIYRGGVVRIFEESIINGQSQTNKPVKPELNI